jgi:hypothetical protein
MSWVLVLFANHDSRVTNHGINMGFLFFGYACPPKPLGVGGGFFVSCWFAVTDTLHESRLPRRSLNVGGNHESRFLS